MKSFNIFNSKCSEQPLKKDVEKWRYVDTGPNSTVRVTGLCYSVNDSCRSFSPILKLLCVGLTPGDDLTDSLAVFIDTVCVVVFNDE